MKPDRSNYEIWLIDWLDGKLDDEQAEMLMAFLNENPDIKEEADSLAITQLRPQKEKSFKKDLLKKDTADLPPSQIEYLSVACLENDLSASHIKELEDNLSQNKDNREIFDAIQRTRLKAPEIAFRHKNMLKKETRGRRIMRLTITGLSAAAAVALLIISFITIPTLLNRDNEEMALNLSYDTLLIQRGTSIISPENVTGIKQQPAYMTQTPSQQVIAAGEQEQIIKTSRDPVPVVSTFPVAEIPDYLVPEITMEMPAATLISSRISVRENIDYDYGRSRLTRFIASTFRDKVLKEETYNDSPLKTHEIAEAGIDGLNKLLGWEMALVKTTDKEGELKSFYFSSRILKFNTPVKKTEPLL
jgi:hypothetical protein